MTINWWQILAGLIVGFAFSKVVDQIKSHQTKANVRESIRKLFYFNLDRCIQMERGLTTPNEKGEILVPNYPFDTDALKQVTFDGIGTFKTKEEKDDFDAINWQRYQLDHLNFKLAHINLSDQNAKGQLLPEFLFHLNRQKKEIETLLGRLK